MSWRAKSYEELPALSVRGKDLRRSLRTVTAAWMFGVVWMTSVGGATMLNFGYLAGFTEFHWGVLSALGFAATLAQLPASYVVERTGLRKLPFVRAMTVSRLMWLGVAAMPAALLFLPDAAASRTTITWVALGIVFTAWSLGHMGRPAWTTWMADLIPTRIRGRYFSRRAIYSIVVQIAAAITVGFILDQAISPQARAALRQQRITAHHVPNLVWILTAIFAFAGVAGAIDALLFRRVREIVRQVPPARLPLWGIIAEPLRDRAFRHFAGAGATLTFGVALAAPFFGLNCQKQLGMTNLQTMLVMTLCGPVGGLVSCKAWGRAIDRWGRRPILVISTAGTVLSVWGWLLVPPSAPYLAGVVVFWGGIVWSGLMMARLNMVLGFSDAGGRSTYAAAANVILAVTGVAGGILGGLIAGATRDLVVHLGPFTYVNYHLMFLFSGVFRGLSLLWLLGMVDPGAQPVGVVARHMAAGLTQNAPMLLFSPFRLFIRPMRAMWARAGNAGPRRRGAGRERGQIGPDGKK